MIDELVVPAQNQNQPNGEANETIIGE